MYQDRAEHHYSSVEQLLTDASFRNWVNGTHAADIKYWDALLEQDARLRPLAEEAMLLLQQLQFRQYLPGKQETLEVKQQIDAALDSMPAGSRYRFMNWRYISAAAAVMVVLLGSVWLLLPRAKTTTVATGFAETKKLVLPDGSTVQLNAHSSIQYASRWKHGAAAEVWINGEAFFQVVPAANNSRSTFTVHAGNLNITVLGTSFDVYNRHNKASAVLETGKIMARADNQGKGWVLSPGQLIRLSQGKLQVEQANLAACAAWKRNEMVFSNTPLTDIAELLEDNYGYTITWKNEQLRNLRFTGSCAGNNPGLLLSAIAEAYNIRVTRNGNNILFE